jgi:acyl carrier protein
MSDLDSIRTQLAGMLEVPVDDLQPDTELAQYANWDSLARMATIALLIELTGAPVGEHDLDRVRTLQDLYDLAGRECLAK